MTESYDEFINEAQQWGQSSLWRDMDSSLNTSLPVLEMKEVKRKLYRAVANVNILEGIRFYVSFACSFAFGELKLMEGSAKIISLIARDENQHLALTQNILNNWRKGDDPDMVQIMKEEEEWTYSMFDNCVNEEKAWAEYLFKDGSIIGLNDKLLQNYVEWIGCKRMKAVGHACPYTVTAANPLPWTQKWIAGGEVQVAPQETEISSYIVGGVKKDVDEGTFKGLSL